MLDTPARLFRLLSLLQIPRDWSSTDLAERLRVTTRTVRRDIEGDTLPASTTATPAS